MTPKRQRLLVSSRPSRTDVPIKLTETVSALARLDQFKPYWVPTLTKKLSASDAHQQRENQFFFPM